MKILFLILLVNSLHVHAEELSGQVLSSERVSESSSTAASFTVATGASPEIVFLPVTEQIVNENTRLYQEFQW